MIRPVRQYNTLLQNKLLEAYHRRNVVVSTSVAVPESAELEKWFCPMVRKGAYDPTVKALSPAERKQEEELEACIVPNIMLLFFVFAR